LHLKTEVERPESASATIAAPTPEHSARKRLFGVSRTDASIVAMSFYSFYTIAFSIIFEKKELPAKLYANAKNSQAAVVSPLLGGKTTTA
jgi:hypothetical protein